MLKSKFFYAAILLVVLIGIAVYGSINNSKQPPINIIEIEDDYLIVTDVITPTPILTTKPVAKPLEYNTWIPSWGSESGINSLRNNQSNNPEFGTISPVWYEIKEDGSLLIKYPANRNEIIAIVKEQKSKLIPAIAMFDHELFTKVLQNNESFQRHISAIVNTVKDNNYDGIDLDYESTKLSDKEKYFEFISTLSSKLKEIDKELVVTVVAKWGDDITYPSLKETRQVQDWRRIAEYASEIRLMAYDYTFINASLPGPIAPLDWVKQVVDYALTQAEASKFSLGIALYSYRWETTALNQDFNYIVNFMHNTTGGNASALQYNQVKNILSENAGQRSNYEAESLYIYNKDDKKYAMTYFSPADIKARVDLAKEAGLKSVTFWRIGNEADQLSLLANNP